MALWLNTGSCLLKQPMSGEESYYYCLTEVYVFPPTLDDTELYRVARLFTRLAFASVAELEHAAPRLRTLLFKEYVRRVICIKRDRKYCPTS